MLFTFFIAFKKEIENKIVVMVTFTDLDTYVTWPSLETALNGLKTQLESASNAQSTSTVTISAHNFTQTVSLLLRLFTFFYFFLTCH